MIIPYQELLGNYDWICRTTQAPCIIPYQELLGNYDINLYNRDYYRIIPYQELLGNYDNIHIPRRIVQEKLSPKSKQQYFNLYIAWMQLKAKRPDGDPFKSNHLTFNR